MSLEAVPAKYKSPNFAVEFDALYIWAKCLWLVAMNPTELW